MKNIGIALAVFSILIMLTKRIGPDRVMNNPQVMPPDPNPDKFPDPGSFLRSIVPVSKEAQKSTGIPWQFIASQLSLESAFGKSAPYFNFFGRKAKKGADGKPSERSFLSWTWEVVDNPQKAAAFPEQDSTRHQQLPSGKWKIRVKDYFKAYHTPKEAVQDYLKLFTYPRYRPALQYKNNWIKFAEAIASAGYTTTPAAEYAGHLVSIFNKHIKPLAHG